MRLIHGMILDIGSALGMHSPAMKVNKFVIRSMFMIRSINFEYVKKMEKIGKVSGACDYIDAYCQNFLLYSHPDWQPE